MDSKVKYALLGGAALIGAAVAFHFMNSAEPEEEEIEAELATLGALQLDS